MVKGVNKTVIEINDTGSKIFEKIVFYVSPRYGSGDLMSLQRAASRYSFQFEENGSEMPLRSRYAGKKKKRWIYAVSAVILLSAAAAGILFL